MAQGLGLITAEFIDIDKAVDNMLKDLITATYRTINVVSKKAVAEIARDISSVEGFKIGSVKRRFKIDRANSKKLYATITISSARLTYPRLRAIKKGGRQVGIQFFSPLEKTTKRMTERVSYKGGLGSKPFIIRGKTSGQKIPVYVAPSHVNVKNTKRKKGQVHPRKVLTIKGPSLPHLTRIDFRARVRAYCLREMKAEYSRQRAAIRRLKDIK